MVDSFNNAFENGNMSISQNSVLYIVKDDLSPFAFSGLRHVRHHKM